MNRQRRFLTFALLTLSLPAFRALKRTAKFTLSLRDEESVHFVQKFR